MRLRLFFHNLQQDLKVFLCLLILLELFRMVFVAYFASAIAPTTPRWEIGLALWMGFRISMKSAGAIALLGFVVASLPQIILPRLHTEKLRTFVLAGGVFLACVLFVGRFPYYETFHAIYGREIVQGANDDLGAIFWTAVRYYGLVWRLLLAVLLFIGVLLCARRLLRTPTLPLPIWMNRRPWLGALVLLIFCPLLFIFVRFGGSLNFTGSINWENAAVTSDAFLNECILDDFQGLYRARAFAIKMKTGNATFVDMQNLPAYESFLARRDTSGETLAQALTHTAKGASIAKPRHIFIVLGETWAAWPLLPEWADLHAADGLKSLIAEDDAAQVKAFMPNGTFTSVAITGMVTGLADIGEAINYQPKGLQSPYLTAMAPIFHRLGYRVEFWYAGYPSWDNIKTFALAQGFDAFYGVMDYDAPKAGIWGTTDKATLAALSKHLDEEAEPTVHLIMTISNHPPYAIDLASEGIDEKEIRAKLEGRSDRADDLAKEVGHYRYMDKVVTAFVRDTEAKYPDSLFALTGDHSIRMDPTLHPDLYDHEAVPFVLYGKGIRKDLFPADAVGSHLAIVPTIVELIAPKGFTYRSLTPSMRDGFGYAFNHDAWMSKDAIAPVDGDAGAMDLPWAKGADIAQERPEALKVIAAMRTVTKAVLDTEEMGD